MAPLPVITNVFRTALIWQTNDGSHAVNVMHFKADSASVPSDLYTAMNAHVTATMWDSVSARGAVHTVSITPLDGTSASQDFSTGVPSKWTGSGSGEYVPALAGLVKITTAKRGREYRGRIFLPFSSEGGQDAGIFATSVVNTVTTAFSDFQTAMLSSDWSLGVASYSLGTWEKMTGITFEAAAATQRRRQTRLRPV